MEAEERGHLSFYLAPKVGSLTLDPSFPVHFKIVLAETVPAWLLAASACVGLTLRPDRA